MNEIGVVTSEILKRRHEMPVEQCMLAGISGIDASGKGYVATLIDRELQRSSIRTALIHADDWLNLPSVRFSATSPGSHFYERALRSDEMFERLILPLKHDRSVRLTAEIAKETDNRFHEFEYLFENIDVILLEGIFIFKERFVDLFDQKIWIECSFKTALSRAVTRSQEGLGPDQTVTTYENTYFPAQLIHFSIDKPQDNADLVVDNN